MDHIMRCPTFSIVFLAGITAMGHRVSASEGSLPPGVLVDAAVDVGRSGEAYSGVITPPLTGVYWFEVRYPHPREDVDAKSPGLPRKFGQPHHEAFGGRLRVEVAEVGSGRRLVASGPRWSPMEIATSVGTKVCGDRLDFRLRKGAAYKVHLSVEEATPALQSFRPRFVIEASDSVLEHTVRSAWNFVALGVLFVFGAFILALARKVGLSKIFRPRPSIKLTDA